MANGNGNGLLSRISFDTKISLGNVLSIVTILLMVTGAAWTLKDDIGDLRGDVRVLDVTVKIMSSRLGKVENRVGLGDVPDGGAWRREPPR